MLKYSHQPYIFALTEKMPLRTYQKSTSYAATAPANWYTPEQQNTFALRQDSSNTKVKNKVTMWDLIAGLYDFLKTLVASSSAAGMVIPMAFIMLGLGFIAWQIVPQQIETVVSANGYYEKGSTPLVDLSYIEDQDQFISNPGADYFRELSNAAQGQAGFYEDEESLAYDGTFYISIPSLNISRLPVKANVDSGTEASYNSVLNSALAHFEGTSLPFSSNEGNIVIYGHSAGGSYTPSPSEPISAFSLLGDLQVGDEITIEMDGETYNYRMVRSKRVKPEETSILLGTPGRETLTLFTCWGYPTGGPGNRSGRLVVTAMPV